MFVDRLEWDLPRAMMTAGGGWMLCYLTIVFDRAQLGVSQKTRDSPGDLGFPTLTPRGEENERLNPPYP